MATSKIWVTQHEVLPYHDEKMESLINDAAENPLDGESVTDSRERGYLEGRKRFSPAYRVEKALSVLEPTVGSWLSKDETFTLIQSGIAVEVTLSK